MGCYKVASCETVRLGERPRGEDVAVKELDNKRLGNRFCVVMDAAGWSVEEASTELGVSTATIYRYMNGSTPLKPGRAGLMANKAAGRNDLEGAEVDAIRSYLLGANLGLIFGPSTASDQTRRLDRIGHSPQLDHLPAVA